MISYKIMIHDSKKAWIHDLNVVSITLSKDVIVGLFFHTFRG